MATRSTIALEFADGTVQMVYCHWDGYLSNNGKLLQEHWTDPFKVRDLIDLGDLSSLSKEIGVKHPFNNHFAFDTPEYRAFRDQYRDMCLFYGRDRDEKDVESRKFANFKDYDENHQTEEYEYILRTDGHWYVMIHGDNWMRLDKALSENEALDD